jgi:hypothetical protein
MEIFIRFKQTREKEEELEIVLPPTPALSGIKEISLTFGKSGNQTPRDLSLTAFEFIPFLTALDPVR